MSVINGFATSQFIEFSKQANPDVVEFGILETVNNESTYPYFIVQRNKDILKGEAKFLLSPICFSGSHNINFIEELESGTLSTADISGGFIQTRDDKPVKSKFITTVDFYAYVDTRTNYRLTLGLDNDVFLSNMRRDSRSRVRSILKNSSRFNLFKVEENLSYYAKIFSFLYADTAKRSGFSSLYQFDFKGWYTLLSSPLWDLFLLEYDGEIVAGAVVCQIQRGFDYTFMGYKVNKADFSRAIIIFIYRYLSIYEGQYLDLGGGISENDSLSRFKIGLGGQKTSFNRMRFARTSALNPGVSESAIKEALKGYWP